MLAHRIGLPRGRATWQRRLSPALLSPGLLLLWAVARACVRALPWRGMSSMNQFHAAESSQRAASDVFKSSATQQASGIASRFASSGKFTHEQLESGEDGKEGKAAEEEDEFDPDDKRPLYERLKSQRDEKQAEWDHAHTFKNQMDHWRLDADDAAFEEDRMAKLKQVEAEASRLHEEGAQFYKLARAQQDRTAPLAAPTAPPQ